jgi:hypothetical protein
MSATRSNDPLLGHDNDHLRDRDRDRGAVSVQRHDKGAVETKPAFKTTEFIAYVGMLAALLITGLASDDFGTSDVWRWATILTVGYMVARGIAKAGSYQPGDDPRS